jgi:hypothetical protein
VNNKYSRRGEEDNKIGYLVKTKTIPCTDVVSREETSVLVPLSAKDVVHEIDALLVVVGGATVEVRALFSQIAHAPSEEQAYVRALRADEFSHIVSDAIMQMESRN